MADPAKSIKPSESENLEKYRRDRRRIKHEESEMTWKRAPQRCSGCKRAKGKLVRREVRRYRDLEVTECRDAIARECGHFRIIPDMDAEGSVRREYRSAKIWTSETQCLTFAL